MSSLRWTRGEGLQLSVSPYHHIKITDRKGPKAWCLLSAPTSQDLSDSGDGVWGGEGHMKEGHQHGSAGSSGLQDHRPYVGSGNKAGRRPDPWIWPLHTEHPLHRQTRTAVWFADRPLWTARQLHMQAGSLVFPSC